MAPPGNRRTSYSRRAQYSTFFTYVAAAVGAVIGALLLLNAVGDHATLTWMRGFASDLTEPFARAVGTARIATSDTLDTGEGFLVSGVEASRLKREVALARVRQVEASALADENRRLKAALKLADDTPRAVTTAWLISSSAGSTRRYATISAGAVQGVRPGMPIRTALGLVGRVLEVGNVSARVLLITDAESVVPVRRASDGIPAFATGRADGTLQVRLLTLGINPLKPGDAFVTSGAGGLYWPGTPIAVVTQLTHDGAIARVLSDPASSEIVTVQPAWTPVHDKDLPPLPEAAGKKPKRKP